MSITKQFCETPSVFEVDNIKNEAILRDFLQKWQVECRAEASCYCVLICFHSICVVLRLSSKSDARSYEVLHLPCTCQAKASQLQNATLSGDQRPAILPSLMNMSLVLRPPRKMHLVNSPSNVSRLPSFCEMPQNPHVLLTFDKVHNPLHLPPKTTSERPKIVRTMRCF